MPGLVNSISRSSRRCTSSLGMPMLDSCGAVEAAGGRSA